MKYVYTENPGPGGRSDALPDVLDEVAAARAAGEVAPKDISLEAVLEAVQEEGNVRLYA